jgi:hypothetical protein
MEVEDIGGLDWFRDITSKTTSTTAIQGREIRFRQQIVLNQGKIFNPSNYDEEVVIIETAEPEYLFDFSNFSNRKYYVVFRAIEDTVLKFPKKIVFNGQLRTEKFNIDLTKGQEFFMEIIGASGNDKLLIAINTYGLNLNGDKKHFGYELRDDEDYSTIKVAKFYKDITVIPVDIPVVHINVDKLENIEYMLVFKPKVDTEIVIPACGWVDYAPLNEEKRVSVAAGTTLLMTITVATADGAKIICPWPEHNDIIYLFDYHQSSGGGAYTAPIVADVDYEWSQHIETIQYYGCIEPADPSFVPTIDDILPSEIAALTKVTDVPRPADPNTIVFPDAGWYFYAYPIGWGPLTEIIDDGLKVPITGNFQHKVMNINGKDFHVYMSDAGKPPMDLGIQYNWAGADIGDGDKYPFGPPASTDFYRGQEYHIDSVTANIGKGSLEITKVTAYLNDVEIGSITTGTIGVITIPTTGLLTQTSVLKVVAHDGRDNGEAQIDIIFQDAAPGKFYHGCIEPIPPAVDLTINDLTEADILTLTSGESLVPATPNTINFPDAGWYIYAYPAEWGPLKEIIDDGLKVPITGNFDNKEMIVDSVPCVIYISQSGKPPMDLGIQYNFS